MSENKNERQVPAGGPGGRRGPMGGGMGMMGGAKAKNFKGTWEKLIKYSRAFVPLFIFALILVAISSVLQIMGPHFLSNMTDEIEKGLYGAIDLDVVFSIGILLVCFYSGSLILRLAENIITANISQKIAKKMRTDLSGKINRLPLGYFHNTSYGDVLSRVTNDVDTIGQTLNQSIDTLIMAATMFIGSIIMMFITNWIMALTAIGASAIGFALMMIILKKSQKFFVEQQKELGTLNGHIEETYTGHNVVKVYNASRKSKKTFEDVNGRLRSSAWKSQFFSGLMMPLMGFIGNFGYVAVCVVGAVLLASGTISSFGIIVAFMIYIRLFTQPLSQFAQAASSLQRTAAAGERVFEFLEAKELDDESQKLEKLPKTKGGIEFKNVKFGYTPDKIVIKDFSAKVEPGQKIAIVGPTGAGKTTMVNLLMRFYEINDGQILIDDVPINSVRREDVRDLFDMVLQDTWLFEGTIKENIIYSKTGISDEEVV
ncbi:MAG: ABC transporter ATP-binding protein, partial [Firmicutes bacterium]|nr:ABC transporter ATP-binding protein [Bacillota bacterium]